MKKNRNRWFRIIISLIFISYLFTDVIHFFLFRLNVTYPSYSEAFFENSYISFIKWMFCLSSLLSIYLDLKGKKESFYLMQSSILGILVLFVLKGQWNNPIIGSWLFKIGVLEIGAFFLIIYLVVFLLNQYIISLWKIIILSLIELGLFWGVFYKLPIF